MRSIAIINQKGGSGKTTTAVNLAATLAERKRSILLIDLDPQGSTSSWFDVSIYDKGIYNVFVHNVHLTDSIIKTDITHIDLIPASQWLVGLEKALAHEVGTEKILSRSIKESSLKKYQYIIIDCPPNLGILTINALSAVNEIIIPVEARILALSGLVQLMQTVDVIKERLNPNLQIAGIVPCRVDARTNHAKEVVETLKSNFQGILYKTAIRENIKLSEAPSFSKPITLYDKNCYGSIDYRALAQEVIKQERKQGK